MTPEQSCRQSGLVSRDNGTAIGLTIFVAQLLNNVPTTAKVQDGAMNLDLDLAPELRKSYSRGTLLRGATPLTSAGIFLEICVGSGWLVVMT